MIMYDVYSRVNESILTFIGKQPIRPSNPGIGNDNVARFVWGIRDSGFEQAKLLLPGAYIASQEPCLSGTLLWFSSHD